MKNKILIPAVFLTAVICIAASFFIKQNNADDLTVNVYIGGKLIKEEKLKYVSEPHLLKLDGNTILIEPDGVSVKSADCPDKICIRQGKITSAGQSIICLPNRVSVELVGSKSEVDAVAGAR